MIGKIELPCRLKQSTQIFHILFYITEGNRQAIMGLPGCISMNLITKTLPSVNELNNETSSAKNLIEEYADVFDGLGKLKYEYSIFFG